jgi:porin
MQLSMPRRPVESVLACIIVAGISALAKAQTSGDFQRRTGTVQNPTAAPTDFTQQLFSGYNALYDQYTAFRNKLSTDYNLTYSLQTSYFLQAAVPYGGKPVSLLVYSPSITWTPFNSPTWGSGQINVSFQQNQYWSGTNTATQQARIGTITTPNDWSANAYNWSQVSYTQTLPGSLSWLSATVGQFGIAGFDGDLYAGNAQTNFITYALAQNATQTYVNGGLGAYLTAAVPKTTLSLSGGFQGATDVPGTQISTRGFQTGKYAAFGNALWAPTVPGMGAGSYNLVAYHQPSVPQQPGQSTGVSFAMSQALSKTYGVFARSNYASGNVIQITSSFGGGGIVNDPFGRHPNDQLGLGLFVNRANSSNIGGSAVMPRLWECGTELYYNYTLVKGLQVTPDAAAILNPVLAPNHGAAYIFTVRLTSYL